MNLLRELRSLNEAVESADLEKAYAGSFFTILGTGGNLNDWVDGVNKELADKKIGKPSKWFKTTGAAINKFAASKGKVVDPFSDDLTVLMFDIKGLNTGKLAMFKLEFGARWFDDIIDNMVEHGHEDISEARKQRNKVLKNRTFASLHEELTEAKGVYRSEYKNAGQFEADLHEVQKLTDDAIKVMRSTAMVKHMKDTLANYGLDVKAEYRAVLKSLEDAISAVDTFHKRMGDAK